MTTLLRGEVARGERVALREKRLGDAPADFRWRVEAELARYDAARPLTLSYQEYMALYREEVLYPSVYRRSFAIEDEAGRHIGNIMYYNIDAVRQEAELGVTIGERDVWGRGYGAEAVQLLIELLLGRMGFRRIHLKTLAWNRRAQRCFAKAGFVECGQAERSGHAFVLMECRREGLAPEKAAAISAPYPDRASP
ncbi:MAG: GNAT family N-acetyltransferase [Chloroflexi bacterium]|nr:GNAT family N-acetyltransferase [Chloroflexota bacterium]